MKIYKIGDQIVFSDKPLTVGEELIPNSTDGAHEKHVPEISIESDIVTIQVSSAIHPSLSAHYIEFNLLGTTTGIHTKCLKPGDVPSVTFKLSDGETALAAFEYCNLHGLWKANV